MPRYKATIEVELDEPSLEQARSTARSLIRQLEDEAQTTGFARVFRVVPLLPEVVEVTKVFRAMFGQG